MNLRAISLKDKAIFERYLKLKKHWLCTYSFSNIFVWRGIFEIKWAVIEESLCIFFRDKIGTFLYLPPLSAEFNPDATRAALRILKEANSNPLFAHIDNIEEKDVAFYRKLGCECTLNSHDYICLREDLTGLKGNDFKSKRASYNYFSKHYNHTYKPLSRDYAQECIKLYKSWAGQRKKGNADPVYQGMFDDSFLVLKNTFRNYANLGFKGVTVFVDKKLKAFTLGYPLDKENFCVFYEVADLEIKGLAQFIFREFSKKLQGYKYINTMDDSGIEGLRKVKLSYHPELLAASYSARIKNG